MVRDIYERYHDQGFEIVSILFEEEVDRPRIVELLKKERITWPQLFDGRADGTNNEYTRRFGIRGLPELLLFDKNGLLVEREGELRKPGGLEAAVKRLLSGSGAAGS